jgi:hypothetical protein
MTQNSRGQPAKAAREGRPRRPPAKAAPSHELCVWGHSSSVISLLGQASGWLTTSGTGVEVHRLGRKGMDTFAEVVCGGVGSQRTSQDPC